MNRRTSGKPAHRRIRVRTATLCAAALFCAGVSLSCSDDPTSVEIVPQCLELDPDATAKSGNVVLRKNAKSECNFLKVDLIATNILDIFSAEITVDYSTAVAAIFQIDVGPLMTKQTEVTTQGVTVSCGGDALAYNVSCTFTSEFEDDRGIVNISISRTNTDDGTVDAGSGEVLATLTFSQLAFLSGARGDISFSYGKLLNADTPPNKIIDIDPNASPPPLTGGTFGEGDFVIVDQ